MELLKKQNLVMIISLLLWITVTLIRVFNHSPWYDEAHAWVISQELNLIEIIRLMKIEGHTFIWYLLLMPFAKTNFMYPYSMLLLNWLFCFIAILILWLKAPFNNWIKFLISFSFPFLALYPVVARCYAIGIMLLFMLAAMDNKKLEHPILYSLLLVVCANTSIMAAIGATAFGIIFLYEMIKNKKNVGIVAVICILGAILFLIQLLGSSRDIVWSYIPMGVGYFDYVFVNNVYANLIFLAILFCFYLFVFIRNRILPLFLIISFVIMFSVSSIYTGNIWHGFFYYIYFIVANWLLYEKFDFKYKKACIIVLCVISFIYILYRPYENVYNYVWKDKSKLCKNVIENNSNVIITSFYTSSVLPYLKDHHINIKNYCSGYKANYDTTSFYRSEYCRDFKTIIKYDRIDRQYEKNKKNYVIGVSFNGDRIIIGKSSNKYFVLDKIYEFDKNWCLYRLEKYEK